MMLRTIRRIHGYAGLALFPWAVLYGVTGLLFNHRVGTQAPSHMVALGTVRRALSPGVLAQRIDSAMNAAADSTHGAGGYGCVPAGRVAFLQSLTFRVARADTTWNVQVDVDSTGREAARLFDPVVGPPGMAPHRTLAQWLLSLHEEARYSPSPDLLDIPHLSMSAGQWLKAADVAWGWPLGVDAMCLALVFWACSGYTLWWQQRSLRPSGGMVVAVSVVLFVGLVAGLMATRGG